METCEEIEVAPEMIKAGLRAWKIEAGDVFPDAPGGDYVVAAIFRAMARSQRNQLSADADSEC